MAPTEVPTTDLCYFNKFIGVYIGVYKLVVGSSNFSVFNVFIFPVFILSL